MIYRISAVVRPMDPGDYPEGMAEWQILETVRANSEHHARRTVLEYCYIQHTVVSYFESCELVGV